MWNWFWWADISPKHLPVIAFGSDGSNEHGTQIRAPKTAFEDQSMKNKSNLNYTVTLNLSSEVLFITGRLINRRELDYT